MAMPLADDYRRLGSFAAARDHIAAARQLLPALPPGPYGNLVRQAVGDVSETITQRVTARRATAPGPAASGG